MTNRQQSRRLIASVALAAIFAILAMSGDDPAAFTPTEIKPAPDPIGAVETQPPEAEAAEIVCTFRCGICRRAPTLTYHEGDLLPVIATCKQCGRKMFRTDPPLTEDERLRLPAPRAAEQSRRFYSSSCST